MKGASGAVRWADDAFVLGDTCFRAGLGATAGPDEFWFTKPREFVDQYVSLISAIRPLNILELGIYQGASVAFFALLAQPRRFVAVDIRPQAPKRLTRWIESHELGDSVRPYFGVDQADTVRLRSIVAAEFGEQPLDLVIDDASHRTGPTRASFNTLLPRLRPGGVYIVEDWAGRHDLERAILADPELTDTVKDGRAIRSSNDAQPTPLSYLLFEIVLASAYTDAISEIRIRRNWLSVTRGPGPLADDFDVSTTYGPLGRSLFAPDLRA